MNPSRHGHRWLLAALLSLPLAACHRVDETRPPPVDLPEHFTGTAGTAQSADRWWTEFGSAPLDGMVEEVLAENLELHQAWARLQQAQAAHGIALAGLYPTLQADAGANTSRQNFNFGNDQGQGPVNLPIGPNGENVPLDFSFPENAAVTGFPMNLAASYEVDLWGRVRHANDAAIEDLTMRRDQVEAQAITLAGEVTNTWFQLLGARERKDLLTAQLEVSESYLELIEFRFERGQAEASAIFQQRSQIAAQRRALPSVDLETEQYEHQLALLLGRVPGESIHPEENRLPDPPPLPAVGPPAELLHRRPDVRAAFRQVLAADHRVGVAIAERFPKLSLSASTGLMMRTSASYVNWVYTLSANLVAPLFEAGRRKAEVARTRAVLEERVAAYGQALLRALVEVEDALSEVRAQEAITEQLVLELEAARDGLESSQRDFLAGKIDYLAVLTAIRNLQRVQVNQLATRGQVIAARVHLYRALGGSWTHELGMPEELTEGGLTSKPGFSKRDARSTEPPESRASTLPAPRDEPSPPEPTPSPEEDGP